MSSKSTGGRYVITLKLDTSGIEGSGVKFANAVSQNLKIGSGVGGKSKVKFGGTAGLDMSKEADEGKPKKEQTSMQKLLSLTNEFSKGMSRDLSGLQKSSQKSEEEGKGAGKNLMTLAGGIGLIVGILVATSPPLQKILKLLFTIIGLFVFPIGTALAFIILPLIRILLPSLINWLKSSMPILQLLAKGDIGGAITAVGVDIGKHLEQNTNEDAQTWNTNTALILNAFATVGGYIVHGLAALGGLIVTGFTGLVSFIGPTIISAVGTVVGWAKGFFGGVLSFGEWLQTQIENLFTEAFGAITGLGTWILKHVEDQFIAEFNAIVGFGDWLYKGITGGIGDFATGVWTDLTKFGEWLYNGIVGGIGDFATGVWSNMTSFGTWLYNGITGAFSTLADDLSGFGSWLFGQIKNAVTGALGGAAGDVTGALGKIAGLFQRGTTYVPQNMLALLHRGESVVPANQSATSGKSGTSVMMPITINITGSMNGQTEQQIKATVQRALYEAIRQAGIL